MKYFLLWINECLKGIKNMKFERQLISKSEGKNGSAAAEISSSLFYLTNQVSVFATCVTFAFL